MKRCWQFHVTIPYPDRPGHRLTKWLGVVAPTMEAALAAVKSAYPEAIFYQVNDRGTVEIITD